MTGPLAPRAKRRQSERNHGGLYLVDSPADGGLFDAGRVSVPVA